MQVLRWLIKYSKELKPFTDSLQPELSKIFHADEIFINCKGKQHYYWDMIDKGTKFIFAYGPYVNECEKGSFFSDRAGCYTDIAVESGDGKYCNSIYTWAFNYPIKSDGGGVTTRHNQPILMGRAFCYSSLAISLKDSNYCVKAPGYKDYCLQESST